MSSRRNEITGWTALRGIAALWVVLYHYRDPFTPVLEQAFFESGYLGVELFFVLSGAVMYYVYEQDLLDGRFSYREFLLKRIARLYPVHLVTALAAAAIIFGLPLLGLREAPPYSLGAGLAVNLAMLQSFPILGGLSLNFPSWSISAEFLAYLAFPLLSLLLLSVGFRYAILACLVLFGLSEIAAANLTGQCFTCDLSLTHLTYQFSLFRVIPEFFAGLLGAAIAFTYARILKKYALPALVLSSLAIAVGAGFRLDILVLVAAIPLIMALALWDGHSPRVLLWLGRLSYSLYMSHVVAKMFLIGLIERAGGFADNSIPLILMPPVILVCIGIAAALYTYVEKPGQKYLLRLLAKRAHGGDTEEATPAA